MRGIGTMNIQISGTVLPAQEDRPVTQGESSHKSSRTNTPTEVVLSSDSLEDGWTDTVIGSDVQASEVLNDN